MKKRIEDEFEGYDMDLVSIFESECKESSDVYNDEDLIDCIQFKLDNYL